MAFLPSLKVDFVALAFFYSAGLDSLLTNAHFGF